VSGGRSKEKSKESDDISLQGLTGEGCSAMIIESHLHKRIRDSAHVSIFGWVSVSVNNVVVSKVWWPSQQQFDELRLATAAEHALDINFRRMV
jgi:hypothetical protein